MYTYSEKNSVRDEVICLLVLPHALDRYAWDDLFSSLARRPIRLLLKAYGTLTPSTVACVKCSTATLAEVALIMSSNLIWSFTCFSAHHGVEFRASNAPCTSLFRASMGSDESDTKDCERSPFLRLYLRPRCGSSGYRLDWKYICCNKKLSCCCDSRSYCNHACSTAVYDRLKKLIIMYQLINFVSLWRQQLNTKYKIQAGR